jgi:2'-5' RNA ligase
LQLQGAGSFPDKAWLARVLWVGLAGDLAEWRKLAGYQQEPHLTVARTRERTDLTNLVAELGRYVGPRWCCEDMALMESQAGGARYETLEKFPLTGSVTAAGR